MFISPDVKMDFMGIKAMNGTDDAFISVEKYSDANSNGKYIKAIAGEIGKVGPFRLVVHPKMINRAGEGAAWVTGVTNDLFRNTGAKFDVYPNMVIGSGAFTHLAFEYGAGTAGAFNVKHKTPEELRTRENPYAKFGMTIIEFWSGILVERPEWIANYYTSSKI
jgi:N4-gp56 family major capsid protein